MMKRIVSLVAAAGFCVSLLGAATTGAGATPSYEIPEPWAYSALEKIAADGLVDGYPDRSFHGDRPRTRAEMAKLIARAIAKLQRNGSGNASEADVARVQKLADAYRYELVLLGVRVTSVTGGASAPGFQVQGTIAADQSFRARIAVPQAAANGTVDPFVNAYLTARDDNNPFEHSPNSPSLLRFDNKVSPTFAFNDNVALSLPIHMQQYDTAFTSPGGYVYGPALVLNVGRLGALRNFYVRAGQLDNLESSRLGLTYRAPDATQQGPGFQNPVQPYDNGLEIGGNLGRHTHFQVAWSTIPQSLVDTFPGAPLNNFFLTVTPSQLSYFQFGISGAPTGGSTHTDTYTAAAPLPSLYLSQKAGLGTVYISAVNGNVCTPAGLTAGGAACPIPPGSWYYIDQTNQIVFQSPLPAGSIVQITYAPQASPSASNAQSAFAYTRQHFTARVNQEFTFLPGTELGFSLSRIVDTAPTNNAPPAGFGNGYGPLSDTVMGFDLRLPLSFVRAGAPVIFAEGAYSKYTPDAFNTRAITDSAAVLGLRLGFGNARLTLQYQSVGANFLDGGPVQFLGPAPATFQGWHGTFMPGFFGFANNLAINQTFDSAVSPGCTVTCTSRNPALTYIYPAFNPFVASGPQFYSDYAPNTRGFSGTLVVPFGRHESGSNAHVSAQRLQELIPDGFGQITFGPGFASVVRSTFDKLEAGVQLAVPVAGTHASVSLSGSVDHLSRNDKTAYAYVPFNTATGTADPASVVGLNTYLSNGATPILFYPNFVDEYHTTLVPSLALPLGRRLSFGGSYNMQTYHGAYASTVGQNIAQRKNDSSASLTYAMPNGMESIGVLFGNLHYTDYVLPTFNFSQNREAVDFTVRF